MGARNANGILVSTHDHTPSLGPFKHRNARNSCACNLRIIIVNSSSADHTVCTLNIFCPMADVNMDALLDQFIGRYRGIHIRAGDNQTHSLQHQTQRPHRHAADTNQVYPLSGLYVVLKFQSLISHILATPLVYIVN